jgi:hypothetical protein
MKRDVWVRHPPGYIIYQRGDGRLDYRKLKAGEIQPQTGLKLLLALYGSMECGRLFWEVYVKYHLALGFTTVPHEPCYLQYKRANGDFIKLAFHVDDSCIAIKGGDSMKDWYTTKLSERFEYTLGPLDHFLGTRFHLDYEQRVIKMDQTEQALNMLKLFGMLQAKPAHTPVPTGKTPSLEDVPTDPAELRSVMESWKMDSAVGALNYLASGTMPGLIFPLKILSRHMREYGPAHIAFCKHVLRWVVGNWAWD